MLLDPTFALRLLPKTTELPKSSSPHVISLLPEEDKFYTALSIAQVEVAMVRMVSLNRENILLREELRQLWKLVGDIRSSFKTRATLARMEV